MRHPSRIRVVVIEDHAPLRDALSMEFDRNPRLKFVKGFDDFEGAEKELGKLEANVVLLDLGLPGMSGVEATGLIKKKWPRLKVLIFSALDAGEVMLAALKAGANGYVLKQEPPEKLAAAIERVHEGGSPISTQVADELVSFLHELQPLFQALSPMEKRILGELEKGVSRKEVAAKLNLSVNTVKSHIKSIAFKTGAASVMQAVYLRKHAVF
jgi:DNA-binding NarL/FixJ family response regulator